MTEVTAFQPHQKYQITSKKEYNKVRLLNHFHEINKKNDISFTFSNLARDIRLLFIDESRERILKYCEGICMLALSHMIEGRSITFAGIKYWLQFISRRYIRIAVQGFY